MWTELPDVQAAFRKGRGTRDQIANIRCIIEKAREFQKNMYFCFIDYANAYDHVYHNKMWKILKETGIADQLTYLLRSLSDTEISITIESPVGQSLFAETEKHKGSRLYLGGQS